MNELEKVSNSSRCQKCGGYVDHISMTCIMCKSGFQPDQRYGHDGLREPISNSFQESPHRKT
jgi:hypothetical protein